MTEYYTVKEMAEMWHVTPRSIQQLCKSGKLSNATKFGRDWMIPKDVKRPEDRRLRVYRSF